MNKILICGIITVSCNSNVKSKCNEEFSNKEIDTIKLNWDQRPKLDIHISDLNGNHKEIIKGDTLFMKVSTVNLMEVFRLNSKIIVDQKMNNNCKTEKINDSTYRLIVSEKPKGTLLSFELMLLRPNTVFQLPNNGGAKNIKSVFFKDSLGISAFAFPIK
ncbi:MAG: hypothetical protein KF704_02335 [Crocinitomicaceae bacterium]|nr:hypothetical protein [Cyclobacteriaceae bacterium]MBX2948090.1 hypothetical protein [Crocinitomicaceae bacterium]